MAAWVEDPIIVTYTLERVRIRSPERNGAQMDNSANGTLHLRTG